MDYIIQTTDLLRIDMEDSTHEGKNILLVCVGLHKKAVRFSFGSEFRDILSKI